MGLLVARNLWRSFGSKLAVAGIDLEVEGGSAYGFIGPNGAGKSTTLRMLATVDRPDAGRVWISGRDTQHDVDAVRRLLGFMPDPFSLIDELTVAQYLEFFAQAYRVPRRSRRSRVARAIELTRIGAELQKRCSDLSKGWRQRVHLAKTLVHDPALLLLDEPAAGLDPAARIEFREVVRTLRDLGKTIVVSSHILAELADFCDAVGVIEGGRMLVTGRIDDVLRRFDPADRLEVQVVGEVEPARAVLESRPDVRAVTVAEQPRPDGVRTVAAQMVGRSDPQARAELLTALVEAGVSVAGLRTVSKDLEELFLEVAGTQAGADAAPHSADEVRELLGGRRAGARTPDGAPDEGEPPAGDGA